MLTSLVQTFALLVGPLQEAEPKTPAGLTQAELESLSAEIAEQVEELRGLEFKQPVPVKIATPAKFVEYALEREKKENDPSAMRAQEITGKMLGLLPADMDLRNYALELLESQVGGFYDPTTKSFYIVEGYGGVLARVILAHELTHALDDQHFDIDARLASVKTNSDAAFAWMAVVEGSGTTAMNAWTLENVDLGDLVASAAAEQEKMKALEDAPALLWKSLLGAYLRGAAFLNRTESVLVGQASVPPNEDVDRAFRTPPRSSEQILHPEKYWSETSDEPVPIAVDSSTLAAGWVLVRSDTLGELGLAFATSPSKERGGIKGQLALLGASYTNEAAQGWGGDAYALLENGAGHVLVVLTTWDRAEDRAEFLAALDAVRPLFVEGVQRFAVASGGPAVSGVVHAATDPDGPAGPGAAWIRWRTAPPREVLGRSASIVLWSGVDQAEAARAALSLGWSIPAGSSGR
jgi:hypothetical protein